MPLKSLLYLISVLFITQTSFAQIEYFVEVNPTTGEFEIINNIPNVNWIQVSPTNTSFDENAGHYIFKGENFDGTNYLYSIDAITGDIVYNPSYPEFDNEFDNLGTFNMDRNNSILYALHWNDAEQTEYFVTVDRINGTFNIISEIENIIGISIFPDYRAFNEDLNHFTFGGADSFGNTSIYTLDAATGNVVASPAFPTLDYLDNITALQYDRQTQTYYAIHWDNSEQTEYLVSFNPLDATFQVLYPIPGVMYISTSPNYFAFNENLGHYIFRGGDADQLLYSVNVNTGEVVSNPIFPVLDDPLDNVIELQYDNVGDKLYALHWDIYAQQQIVAIDDVVTIQGECLEHNVPVLNNDDLLNADNITITLTNNPLNGTASIDETLNEIVIIIEDIQMDLPIFTYEICDETGTCAEAEITFIEEACPSPEPPVEVSSSTIQNQLINLNFDASYLPTNTVTTSFYGSLTIINDTTIQYQPANNFIGTDSWISQEIFVSECCGTWPTSGINIFIEVMADTTMVSVPTNIGLQFEIGPNPFNNQIKIKNIFEKDYKIQLFDLRGRLIAQSNAKQKLADLNHLAPSMYLLKLEAKGETYYKKMLKQ